MTKLPQPPPYRPAPQPVWLGSAEILDQVHDAVISTDLAGTIQSWNSGATSIYGWPADEAIGQHVSFLYPEEDRPLLHAKVIGPLQKSGSHEITVRNRHRSGREIFVALRLSFLRGSDGQPIGMVGCSNDITEQKHSADALRREQAFSESVIETAQSIIMILDTEGRIVRFNRFMEVLSGYTLDEVRGLSWFETFLPSRDAASLRDLFQKAIVGEKTQGNINPIRIRDGSERQISWWDTPLVDLEGRAQGLLVIGHDVTELVEAQEEIMLSRRLATIGETVTTLAHETRNELDALGLGIHLLSESALEPRDKTLVARLQASHARLEKVFEDLKDFAAPIHLDRVHQDLAASWRRAWTSLGAESRGAKLRERLETEDLACPVDALRMEQVFRNLFENCLAACPDPAKVEILGKRVEEAGRSWLQIAVRDNGPGLDPRHIPKLFDPFFTTRNRGTGLGLAVVRRILDAHGGRVLVGDLTRPGAEFVLMLPA